MGWTNDKAGARPSPWSQVWGWGPYASSWLPGFQPRSPARLSLKERMSPASCGSSLLWANHRNCLPDLFYSLLFCFVRLLCYLQFVHHKYHVQAQGYTPVLQDALGRSSMINFVVVSSDLRRCVSATWVKREPELSTDHSLLVSCICCKGRKERLDKPQCISRVCWECLAEPPVIGSLTPTYRRTSPRSRGRLAISSPNRHVFHHYRQCHCS